MSDDTANKHVPNLTLIERSFGIMKGESWNLNIILNHDERLIGTSKED